MAQTGKGACIPYGNIITGAEVTNVIIDVTILCLPAYMIKTLQLPIPRKIGLMSIFLLGGFVCIICVVRIFYVANIEISDNRNDILEAVNWTTGELAAAIICACLPTYGPLLRDVSRITTNLRYWIDSQSRSKRAPLDANSQLEDCDYSSSVRESRGWRTLHDPLKDIERVASEESYQMHSLKT